MKRSEIALWMRASVVLVAGAAAAMVAGCSPQPAGTVTTIGGQ